MYAGEGGEPHGAWQQILLSVLTTSDPLGYPLPNPRLHAAIMRVARALAFEEEEFSSPDEAELDHEQ